MWLSRKKLERSICLGLVVAARQSRVGSKFPNLKILNFLLLPQNFTTNQGLHSNFPHPVPRTACQCPYAKEMRWIGPKMTELDPFSWMRSKFLKICFSRKTRFLHALYCIVLYYNCIVIVIQLYSVIDNFDCNVEIDNFENYYSYFTAAIDKLLTLIDPGGGQILPPLSFIRNCSKFRRNLVTAVD